MEKPSRTVNSDSGKGVKNAGKFSAKEESCTSVSKPLTTRQESKVESSELIICPKTIHIFNLANGVSCGDVRKKLRKLGKVTKVIVLNNSASVTFASKQSTKIAINTLDNRVFKGKVVNVVQSTSSKKLLKVLKTPSRIVIRNLSFKTTPALLKAELEKFGTVGDISLPKASNGMVRGFAFVSYVNKFQANKALQSLNGKILFGRKVAVDWAIGKQEYNDIISQYPRLTESETSDEKNDAKNEIRGNDQSDGTDSETQPENITPVKKFSDVHEGRTVFVHNISFEAEKADLHELFSEFGTVHYVRMLFDDEKNRFKGSAFVQFTEKKAVDNCLAQGVSFGGRNMIIKKAVEKEMIMSFEDTKNEFQKSDRNLNLSLEGIIKEGTKAAEGVSKSDMAKRNLALESKKTKLKNSKYFVSTDRLCIRNMPSTFDEIELKKLMSKFGQVIQVKIMRDLSKTNSNGVGKSRGYGFVQFNRHNSALTALRAINNNPDVFSNNKRPIVDFAVENSAILKARGKNAAKIGQYKTKMEGFGKKPFKKRWQETRLKLRHKRRLPERKLDQ